MAEFASIRLVHGHGLREQTVGEGGLAEGIWFVG